MSLRREIVWLADREHRRLNWLAALAVPVFVAAQEPWRGDHRSSRLALAAFGIAFAFAFWLVGRMRHRLWAAFASFLMLFGPWNHLFLAGLVYVAFAFWLVWQARRDLTGNVATDVKEPPAPT
jgi:hypothetical protein